MTVKRDLENCLRWPYNIDTEGRPDGWRYKPEDEAEHAALAIIYGFSDRRGIKRGFENIDDDIQDEIVETVSETIRQAFALNPDGDEVVISKQSLKDLLFLAEGYTSRGHYNQEAYDRFAAAVAEGKEKLGGK